MAESLPLRHPSLSVQAKDGPPKRLRRVGGHSLAILSFGWALADAKRHYVGLTHDVARRLDAHNAGHSIHTSRHRPWRLIASIEFTSEASAIAFERYLKSGSGRAFAKRHFV